MNQKPRTSNVHSGGGFWFFLLWFLICFGIYLWNIPPHPLQTLRLFLTPFQDSSWSIGLTLEIWESHLLWLLMFLSSLAILLGTGERLLNLLNEIHFLPVEKWTWSLALGLVFWGLLAEGFAIEKLFYPLLLKSLWVGALLVIVGRDRSRSLKRCWPVRSSARLPWFWKGAIAFIVLISLCNLLAPEMSWDAMTYQLILPKFYLLKHGFYKVDGIVPANYPSLGQMFFSWGLIWGNDSLARAFSFLAHLGTAMALVGLGSRLENPMVGCFAGVFYWAFPYLNIFSTRGYVDLFLGFYAVIGLGTLIVSGGKSREASRSGEPNNVAPLLLLGTVSLGAVWGIKYNALAYWFTGVVLWFLVSGQNKAVEKRWGWFALGPLFFFLPWALKSWLYVHDPIFPFLPHSFRAFDWSDFDQKASGIKFHVEGFSGLLSLPKVLWGLFFGRYGGAPNEEVSLIPLVLSPLLFLRSAGNAWRKRVIIALLVPFGLWSVTSHQLRLITPVIAFASLLAASAYENFLRRISNWGRTLNLLMGLYLWLLAYYLFQGLVQQPNPFANFLGFQSRERFLTDILRPTGYLSVAKALNQTLPSDSKILSLGQQNGYYLERISAFDFDYTEPVLRKLVEPTDSPESIYRRFKEDGFTHILYNANAMMGTELREDVLGVERFPWKSAELKNYEQFFLKYTRKISLPVGQGYSLYEIGPRDGYSSMPEYLPGTEAYYLRSMVRTMGLSKASEIVGKSIPQEVYLKSYREVAQDHPELGYPCFQWAFAKLSGNPKALRETKAMGEEGLRRNGDKTSWLVLQGDGLMVETKFSKAIPLFEEAEKLSPEREDVARNLTSAYYNKRDLKKALEEAERAASLAPYAEDYRQLADSLRAALFKK